MNTPLVDFAQCEDRRLKWIEVCRGFPQVEASVGQELARLFIYHSNALSGSPVNQETTELILEGKLTHEEVEENHYWEVVDHRAALAVAQEEAAGESELGQAPARRLHALLGEHYRPAPPPEKPLSRFPFPHGARVLPQRGLRYPDFDAWESFVASENFRRFHPIKQAARVHHGLVDLQPFAWGNGKLARLMLNLVLLRHGYPMIVLKEDESALYHYVSRHSLRRFTELVVAGLEESFQRYYQQVPAKFRPYESRQIDYPADMGRGRRSRGERRGAPPAQPSPPPAS